MVLGVPYNRARHMVVIIKWMVSSVPATVAPFFVIIDLIKSHAAEKGKKYKGEKTMEEDTKATEMKMREVQEKLRQ